MSIRARRLVIALAVIAVVTASAASAFATITAPSTNPFHVPDVDADNVPDFFTITANGSLRARPSSSSSATT